jgi:hypothetical protein
VKLTIGATGTAAPEVAWDRYVHPALWPTWSPQITSVDSTDETLRSGTTGTVHGPLGVTVPFTVLEVDAERRSWSWHVTAVGIALTLHHSVRLSNEKTLGGSATTLVIDGPAPVVLGYAPLARVALGRLVR